MFRLLSQFGYQGRHDHTKEELALQLIRTCTIRMNCYGVEVQY